MLKTKYLSKEALLGLNNYKYQAGEYSLLDHILTRWWNFAVELLPMWIAPNLVTLIGLGVLMVNHILILPNDLTMTQELPWFVSFYAGLSLFLYTTLDAIDGK